MSVQSSIDSRNSAIHSAYRISLRPSSLPEPRHPSLKVVEVGRSKAPNKTHGMVKKIGETTGGSTREAPLAKPAVHPESTRPAWR